MTEEVAFGQDIVDYEDPETQEKLRLFQSKQQQLKEQQQRASAALSTERGEWSVTDPTVEIPAYFFVIIFSSKGSNRVGAE